MQKRRPAWRFAPNMGGAEQGNSPGQQHFAAGALTAMVRETLQNSLDHQQDGLGPVEVSYQLIQIRGEDIQATDLAGHVQACLQETAGDTETEKRYARMRDSLRQDPIPCLAVVDQNTTGLRGNNWTNLILREGIPSSGDGQTKGGSFGFGKNAPFNLAGAGAVIYSTRYLDVRTRKGRVMHMTGRAQLRTHNGTGGERLQSAGFLAVHEDEKWNQPIEGPEVPGSFALQGSGTGVYILGFDQAEHPKWEDEIMEAALSQFFPAVRCGNLVVRTGNHTLDRHTLREKIDNLDEKTQPGITSWPWMRNPSNSAMRDQTCRGSE